MKVRVKAGQKGFIYGKIRNESEEFTLKPVKKTGGGTIAAADQFSDVWMKKVDGRTKEVKQDTDEK